MQSQIGEPATNHGPEGTLNVAYVCGIATVAALGGLLFGYDWVVIGGAKPFYEAYFHLANPNQVGWANSCALVGCLGGSLLAGGLNQILGRKGILLIAAVLFAISSLLTGWSYTFISFIMWRILGGVAIGLASNVSPTYIAEISPAAWRGRLVSLNQLALVVGILAAQIVDWQITRPMANQLAGAALEAHWNVQYAWRWMFSVVSIPAIVLLLCLFFIPESPRWLATRDRTERAFAVLERIGGRPYARRQLEAIQDAVAKEKQTSASVIELFQPALRKVLLIGVVLAVLQQWSGINIIFNYAEEIYRAAGYGMNQVLFNIVVTGTINLVFTLVAMGCIDRFGRRGLMIWGCLGVGTAHLLAASSYHFGLQGRAVLLVTLAAIACYAVSLAPVTWVLISEIYPNRVRGAGVSVAVSALWASAFVLTYTFPFLNLFFGTGGTFLLYGLICLAGAVFVSAVVQETRGRSLEQLESEFTKRALSTKNRR